MRSFRTSCAGSARTDYVERDVIVRVCGPYHCSRVTSACPSWSDDMTTSVAVVLTLGLALAVLGGCRR